MSWIIVLLILFAFFVVVKFIIIIIFLLWWFLFLHVVVVVVLPLLFLPGPLRRALARLEDEGLVSSVHGVGTLVTDVDIGEMTRTYEFRRELAGLVGRLTPAPITPDIIAQARHFEQCATQLRHAPDAREFARLNMEFFHFGTSLTENEALRDTSERLYYKTARIWLKSIPRMDLSAEVAIFADEIRDIRAALESGDTMGAALIRQAHISMCFARLHAQA